MMHGQKNIKSRSIFNFS